MNLNEFKEILNNDLYAGVFGIDKVIVEYTTYGEAFEKSPSFYITLVDDNGQRTKLATIKNHAVSFGKDFNRIDVADIIFQFANQSQEEQFDITKSIEFKKSELDLIKDLVQSKETNFVYDVNNKDHDKNVQLYSDILDKINKTEDAD